MPCLPVYLKSRIIQTKYVEDIEKGIIQPLVAAGISTASYWLSTQERESLIASGEVEQEIRVEYIDIATLHSYTHENTDKFFEALSDCTNYELFEQAAIKKIIEFKWPLLKEFTIKTLLLPYMAFMCTCLYYFNYAYLYRFDEGFVVINYLCITVLAFFSGYFVKLEVKQLMNEGAGYLTSFWNYLDIIPPFALAIFLPLELFGLFDYREAA